MKIKLIDKEKPITEMFCFKFKGYDSTLIETINSGKQVEVERIPKKALEYVEEIKKQPKKSKGELSWLFQHQPIRQKNFKF